MLGLHVSISGSIDLAFDRAAEVGATTFQIFTRNPNQWKFKPIPKEVAGTFREKRKAGGFRKIVDHMPYLPNLSSSERGIMRLSRQTLDEEVKRCDELGIEYLVTHLGSHLGGGTMLGVRNLSEAINEALAGSDGDTMILLENMAGQKNSVGSRFEDLRLIIDRVKRSERVGVCLDSCHAFAAGFDLTGPEQVKRTMELFDETVGEERLKVLHLNDSKGSLGSGLDRHENIGEGKIGKKGMRALVGHDYISKKVLIMETPYEDVKDMKLSMKSARSLFK